MDIRPDYANIEKDGKLEKVDPDEVEIGSVIVVQPGEKVPIDGVIVEGTTTLNTSALTGESLPRSAKPGDEIISGCINMTGVLKIRTTKEFGESTVSKILELDGGIPVPANPDPKTLFPNLPAIILRQSAMEHLPWQSCRRLVSLWEFFIHAPQWGASGSTVH